MPFELEHLPADVFALSELARLALAGRPQPPSLPGLCIPDKAEAVPRPKARLEADERAALSAALQEKLSGFEPHVAVLDSIRALAAPGTAVVVTGQQPGFLGGPLYDAYKALHAIRLARELSQHWETPVVPLFWNHADDHDVAEVHHLHLLNPNLDLQRVALAGLSSGRRPFAEIVLTDAENHLGSIRELLRRVLPEGPHREQAVALFMPREAETFSNAFSRLLTALFGPLGLVVLEPGWIREDLSRRLARVIEADPLERLQAGSDVLRGAGHPVAIDPTEAALVFRHEDGRRRALRAGGDGFRFDEEPGSRTAAELAAAIVQDPLVWSPGALLRPVLQDLALPIAAYVGGWGELGYLAQLGPLREAVGAPATPFVPRLSCTLIDPDCRSSLQRLSLPILDALRAGQRMGEEAEERPGPPVEAGLRAVADDTKRRLEVLRDDVAAIDPGLAGQVRRTATQVAGQIDKLAGKVARAHANRAGGGRRHLRRTRNTLAPKGLPQERVLGTLQFVARFGTRWLERLAEEMEPFPSEHLVLHLAAEETP